MFAPTDIVEIDECYLKALNNVKGQTKQVWIIGMIARGSGRIALKVSLGHDKEEMRRCIMPHLPHASTVTISDRHQSFNFLEESRQHLLGDQEEDRTWHVGQGRRDRSV